MLIAYRIFWYAGLLRYRYLIMKRIKKLFSRKTHEKNESGQSLVEFAIVLPLMLVILCGIIDFGWIYSNRYKAQYAAYNGARYAVLHVNDMVPAQLEAIVEGKVRDGLQGGSSADVSVSITSARITVEVVYPIRTLTFVANTIYGNYYNADCISSAGY